jgi:cobalt/nickel transport system ATP-binding protein
MSENILEVEKVSVTYPDGAEALAGISMAVAPAERVGLIGPNGAGKTSLLLAIMRAVSFEGRIVVDGVTVARRTADEARSRCGMTFQDADDQLFMPTLLDDVTFGPLNQGCDAETARERAQYAIAAVGLAGLEGRSAHHLSGGQKRNAALATILSMQVKMLLLDEPGVNLDFRSRQRLIELLGGREEAMLLATHDLDMVRQLCERVIILDDGQVHADMPTGDALDNRDLLAAHGLA